MRYLVTGGAGFLGSCFIRLLLENEENFVVNYDVLTYAANLQALDALEKNSNYCFVKGDILDGELFEKVLNEHKIETVVHFAAESHVDRSIDAPDTFLKTNIEGTYTLLEGIRRNKEVRFHHISTDEVYGSIKEGFFTESSPYQPNSPYSASKAASDHMVRAYQKTYGLKTTISHASNNYGAYQHQEKFIPTIIYNALTKKKIPLYGSGKNVREWIYVEDHAKAVYSILEKGKIGEVYNIGGGNLLSNVDLLDLILEKIADKTGERASSLKVLISPVKDRLGHDFRYAIDGSKIENELGWRAENSFEQGIDKTLDWYINWYIKNEKNSLCHTC